MNDHHPPAPENFPPTDPQLDALLDEALATGDVPAGLNDRIVAATAERLPVPAHADDTPTVIGKIGGGFAWRALAAVLLFALILGGAWVFNDQDTDESTIGPAVADGGETEMTTGPTVEQTPQIDRALGQLAEAELEAEWIDDRIAFLSMQVTWAQDAGDAGVWGDGAFDALDTAIARETFDDVADEMEWYF